MHIEAYDFGEIRIDGHSYRADVIIWPDRVKSPWRRAEGHHLAVDDLDEVLLDPPALLVIGTGFHGCMAVPPETLAALRARDIEVRVSRTRDAVAELNRLSGEGADVVGAFHLTC